MTDIIGRAVAVILLVAVILFGVALFLNTADSNIQTKLKDDSISFVDSCRGLGKIDPIELITYIDKVENCGDFEAVVSVEKTAEYYDETQDRLSHSTTYIAHKQLLDAIYSSSGQDKPYILHSGDRIQVEVRRTGAGFTALFGLIGRGGREGDLITSYGGLVLHDGR